MASFMQVAGVHEFYEGGGWSFAIILTWRMSYLQNFLRKPIFPGRIIRSSYICNLEKGGESNSLDGDFHWDVQSSSLAYIVPQNGATFYVLGYCPNCFGTETYQNLKSFEAQDLFTGNAISTQSARQGTIIVYITRNHLYGLMRIEAITPRKGAYSTGLDLKISFKTLGN